MKKTLSILLLISSIIPLFAQGVLIDRRGLIYREHSSKLYVAKSLPEGEQVRKLGWDGDERFYIITKKNLFITYDRFKTMQVLTEIIPQEAAIGETGELLFEFPELSDVSFNETNLVAVSDSTLFRYSFGDTMAEKVKTRDAYYFFCCEMDDSGIYAGTSQNGVLHFPWGSDEQQRLYRGLSNNYYTKETNYFEEVIGLFRKNGKIYAAQDFGINVFVLTDTKEWQPLSTFYEQHKVEDFMVGEKYITLTSESGSDLLFMNGLKYKTESVRKLPDDFIAGIKFEEGAAFRLQKEPVENNKRDGVYSIHIPPHRIRDFTKNMEKYKKMGFNTVVMPFKDDHGYVLFPPSSHIIKKVGADHYKWNMKKIIKRIKKGGFNVVARVVCFKDKVLFKYDSGRHAFVNIETGEPWKGAEKEYWVDPGSRFTREYVLEIIKETARLGVSEIQLDYIRYPTEGAQDIRGSRHMETPIRKEKVLAAFLRDVSASVNIPVSVDVYGLKGWYNYAGNPGQVIPRFAEHIDILCPMLYPSHFDRRFFHNEDPLTRVYNIIFYGVKRNLEKFPNLVIRPYIQAFANGSPEYSKEYLEIQIRALYDAGASGFTFWGLDIPEDFRIPGI
ncbi:hypothetical protein KAI78_06520 [bacterium]|nr:hypothetical protein [bacterium]